MLDAVFLCKRYTVEIMSTYKNNIRTDYFNLTEANEFSKITILATTLIVYQENFLKSEERNILNGSLGYSTLTAFYASKMHPGPECSQILRGSLWLLRVSLNHKLLQCATQYLKYKLLMYRHQLCGYQYHPERYEK